MSDVVTLGSAPGPVVRLLPFGATVQSLVVTGGDGVRRDVVLGHPSPTDYRGAPGYVGATIGRYANRIAGGRFELDGREVVVAAHDHGHSLHAGPDGFDQQEWVVVHHDPHSASLRLVSPDGDRGFPGEVVATAHVAVSEHALAITYEATTDAPTVVAMTHHGYANLGDGETIDDHLLTVPAASYTPADADGIPTGRLEPVAGTAYDLRTPRGLGELRDLDHNFVVDGTGLRDVAVLDCPATRTRLTVASDQPGLQVFTAGTFDGSGPPGLGRGAGVALEPQLFPDSPHHVGDPDWTDATLRPGQTFHARIVWTFSELAAR
ncbi:aldose epimerase family protein [Nocardioides sp. C4-1]|uniref:aldose epimerase family protein n=1 Tax=Nocardioides sp. C4-1 TaxID=3151851 RepID=UPI00326630C0